MKKKENALGNKEWIQFLELWMNMNVLGGSDKAIMSRWGSGHKLGGRRIVKWSQIRWYKDCGAR